MAWVGFIASLFPALGFVDVYPFRFSFVADHFQYLASAFFIALVVGLVHGLYKRLCRERSAMLAVRAIGIGLVVFVVVLLGSLGRGQAGIYEDTENLWLDTLEKNPRTWLGWNNLGATYFKLGRPDKAMVKARAMVSGMRSAFSISVAHLTIVPNMAR